MTDTTITELLRMEQRIQDQETIVENAALKLKNEKTELGLRIESLREYVRALNQTKLDLRPGK
jgi:hypothetical protein